MIPFRTSSIGNPKAFSKLNWFEISLFYRKLKGMESSEQSLEGRLNVRLEVLPGDSVLERVGLAAEAGFDGIAFPGRFRDRFGTETLEALADLPLPIRSVSLGFEGSLCSPNGEERQRCHDSLQRLFEFTSALGAPCVNMPPALIQDNTDRFPPGREQEQDQLLIDQLPELGDEAEKFGILLLIEPVNGFETDYLTTVGHAAKICRQVDHPAVGLTPDFFHMQMEELDLAGALGAASEWVRLLHVAENTRVEPGPGQMDFRPGFRALKEAGYEGMVEVECRKLSGPAREVLPRSVEYLRREWENA